MVRGTELAMAEVHDTTAVLLWPARMTWVGPETITSLIEAHGLDHETVLRPAWQGEPGWPVLVPTTHLTALRAVAADRMPPEVIADLASTVASRIVEVGDPGVTHDVDSPLETLPAYEGPPDPPGGRSHEWGADVAAEAGLTEPG
jgi:CTP:molybdopterin cytidylyltransferase MocA